MNKNKKDTWRWILRLARRILAAGIILIVLVNIIEPAIHPEITDEMKLIMDETEYKSDSVSQERYRCIDENEEALIWRLRMIESAEQSIILATFDFRADESGKDIMSALFCAAQRGVKVQLLVDGIDQILYLSQNDTFNALCAHENVEARFYNVPNLRNILKVNYRMHDKYLMIDEKMYLLGGRNTNDIFLGNYQSGVNIDREILVYENVPGEGDSFLALREYFGEIWDDSCVQKKEKRAQINVETEYQMLEERYQQLCERYENLRQYDSWLEDTLPADKITLLTNGIHAEKKEPQMLAYLEQLMTDSEEIIIQTPYVICDKQMYRVLQNISKTADVKIILNAVERGSNPWGCTDYLNNKNKILDTGVAIYELMNVQAVHTKTILVDDRISIVGSYNLDMRSTYLDTELMLVIDSEELNTHIREMCSTYMDRSIEVLDDKTEIIGEFYNPRELTWKKQLFYGLLRIIIRPFRYLL
ncbi:MAG: phosphatidylserine/phosphatidylglycerophosphate/cardiolipin synthase family protein [Lachnospiraceae bacterium]